MQAKVLVVEDNPITRKLIRAALHSDGYQVFEAGEVEEALRVAEAERPDLILQDLQLPGRDGWELLRELRSRPWAAHLPIIATSGYLADREQAQSGPVDGFTDFLPKPFDAAGVRDTVRRCLAKVAGLPPGAQRLVLLVDDDPLQRRLSALLFRSRGFRTAAAADGEEALRMARQERPAVIVSDVLMPRMDGMQLCLAIRTTPDLFDIPVILTSSYSMDNVDQQVAGRMGASRFVSRTSRGDELVRAALEVLEEPPPPAWKATDLSTADQLRWVSLQLERQMAVNAALSARCALQSAALTALSAVSESLSRNLDPDYAMDLILTHGLDAAGLSRGAFYWIDASGSYRPRSVVGYAADTDFFSGAAPGIRATVDELLLTGEPAVLPSAEVPDALCDELLRRFDARSALLIPVRTEAERTGLLVLMSGKREMVGQEWISFGKTLATKIGQAALLSRAVDRMRASEALLQSIMDNAGSLISVKDRDGRYLMASRQLERFLNVPSGQAKGRTDGELYPGDVAVELRALDEEALCAGSVITHEDTLPSPGGPRTFVSVRFPLRDEVGSVFAVGAISTDITDRKAAEEQLRQSQRMDAIGQLAGGVAHDFNNLLSVILGHSELIREEVRRALPDAAGSLELVEKAAKRATGLTRQLLAFSRRQVLQPRVLNLDTVVKDTVKLLRRLIGEDIQLEIDPRAATWNVHADAGQLEQVVMNLAVNARDAMPTGGQLEISTKDEVIDEAAAVKFALSAGRYVVMVVRDTGCGMDRVTQSRIFEPFFTTKPRDRGTGLGLAMAYGIVKQSGGHVAVESEVGRGTTFRVYLPAIDAPVQAQAQPGAGARPRGSETILLVEDEEDVRLLGKLVLERHGYRVLEAHSAGGARTLASSFDGRIDLLITDVVMPGNSGPELARSLGELRPRMKVLFISGYTDDAMFRHGISTGEHTLLVKPFGMDALLARVRETLDAARG